MSSPEFDYVNDIAMSLGVWTEAHGIDSLSEVERNVLLIWWSHGIIGNGGFRYYYEGADNIWAVADAYAALGFNDAAEACRKSAKIIPAKILEAGPEAITEWLFYDVGEEKMENWFYPLDMIIYDLDDDDKLVQTMSEYIGHQHIEEKAES